MKASLLVPIASPDDTRIERRKRQPLADSARLNICAIVSGVMGWRIIAADRLMGQ